jgi:spermidine synthase
MTSTARRLPPLALPFAGLFVISGACGLTYEVVWSRLLVHVFGVTAFAVSTVLVSFMGGMALGAALMGRMADRARRPLRMFAILEAGIGAYALILPWLLKGIDVLYRGLFPDLPGVFLPSSIRFVLCLLVLMVPTVLMGGTLPALGQGLLRRSGEVGLGVGVLYFVNTLGAALGCYLAGFTLIPALGLQFTTLLAASLNAVVALTAWWLDRRPRDRVVSEPAPSEHGAVPPPTTPRSWPLVVAFGSGMAALAFEVVWFRVLVLSFGSTVYSFSAMLAVFLLGLALGSLALGALVDRVKYPVRLLAMTQVAVALFALVGSVAVNGMPDLFLRVIQGFGLDFDGMNRTKLFLSFLTLLPPAFAFGGTFPVAVRLFAGQEGRTGSRIGRVYAWNTVGAIVGAFGAGFVLLPTIGSEWVLRLVIVTALCLAFGTILAEPGRLRVRWAVPMGLVVVTMGAVLVLAPGWDRTLLGAGVYFEPRKFLNEEGEIALQRVVADYELMTFTEGYNDTIISFRSPKGKFITVNGSATASDQFEDMFSQRMLGHLPMALHPGPVRKACIVGLGAGVTAGAIGLYEVDRLVAVELERGVFDASRFFEHENHFILDNPAVDIRIDDGRNYLRLTEERFDVISSAPNFPSLTGSGALYSREYFDLCRRRLAPGGTMCQFAPIWRLYPDDVKVIVASFLEVFPHVRVFSTGLSLVMLGREEPFPPVDIGEVARRVERDAVRESLLGIGVRGPVELLSFYRFDEDEAREYAAGAPLNTDDRPRIEFSAPRALFASTVGRNLEEIREHRVPIAQRLGRLGIDEEYASSYRILASAYDATVDAEVALSHGDVQTYLDLAVPVAESGAGYARYLVADHFERKALDLQRSRKLIAAAEAFKLALRYDPGRADSLIGLGYVNMFLGLLDEAESSLTEAVRLYPRSAAAAFRLGALREVQGRLDEAEDLYRTAVALQPMLATPHALLANRLLARDEPDEALEEFDRAVDLGERSEGVILGRVDALLRLGRHDAALEGARRAAGSFPLSPGAFDLLERAARAAGFEEEADSARERRDEILRLRPPAPGNPPGEPPSGS